MIVVKLREREGQGLIQEGQSKVIFRLKIVNCRLSMVISLKLYTKFGCHLPTTHLDV